MKRKALPAAAALLTTFALTLTACSGGDAPTSDTGKITMMAPYFNPNPPSADGKLEKKIDEFTGKDLNITWVPNASYGDKLNITLASSDVPQVMVFQGKTAGFVKNAQAGGFWDLTDKLDAYPNLKTAFPDVQQNSSVNGKVFGIYRGRAPMRASVLIRQDWLDKLGLQPPKTVEDLYNVAKAFTEKDPDGNGQNDTWGITIPKGGSARCMASSYDMIDTWLGTGNCWSERDGKLVPNFETDEFLESSRFIKKMVDEKLINSDFATFDGTKWNEPFLNGKSGLMLSVSSGVNQLITLFKQANPNDYQNKVGFVGNLEGPDGKLRALPTDGYSGLLAIPKSSVRTEADLKNVLSTLDKLNSPEGARLLNNGIEGVNYEAVDNKARLITPETPETKAVTADATGAFAQLGMNVRGNEFYPPLQATEYEQKMYDSVTAAMNEDLKSAVYNPAAAFVSETYVAKGAQLDNIIADARIKYFAGQIDEQGLKDAIKLWDTSGGNKVKEEINKLWQENKK